MKGVYRLFRDAFTVIVDSVDWLFRTLWRLNRGLIRGFLPGQSKAVQSAVTAIAVLLEIVGLTVVAIDWAARH